MAAQFSITASFVLASALSQAYFIFIKTHIYLFWIALIVSLATIYALACYQDLARSVPINYILLGVFTVAESYLVSMTTAIYTPSSIANASLLTAALVIGLTVYAFYTDTDFTMCGGFLFMMLSLLLMASIIFMFFPSRTFDMILSILGVVLFGFYLIYDTQMIIGGEGKAASYMIDDYVLAAVNIYLDVINIFLEILNLIGTLRGDDN